MLRVSMCIHSFPHTEWHVPGTLWGSGHPGEGARRAPDSGALADWAAGASPGALAPCEYLLKVKSYAIRLYAKETLWKFKNQTANK